MDGVGALPCTELEASRRFSKVEERRDFLGLAAIGSAVVALGAALVGVLRLPMPSVLPESNPRVKLGPVKPFAGADETFVELSRYYSNSALVIGEITAADARASEMLCWPHHFDIATLLPLDAAADVSSEEARSVGIGMTPGDGGVDVPYFYVTPWPYPPVEGLPELDGGGHWNTEGWVGALLRGDAIEGDAGVQRDQVASFVTSAVAASISLLG